MSNAKGGAGASKPFCEFEKKEYSKAEARKLEKNLRDLIDECPGLPRDSDVPGRLAKIKSWLHNKAPGIKTRKKRR